MSVTLETICKDYKNNEDMINKLMKTLEDIMDLIEPGMKVIAL